ncbi:MAG TPA: sulfatase-like hydrolase/transferase [Steroidobacteraceae bacterium]|nr:sulfatase-like hydrolase/transferase [Steroidobacteraceae bacterium]
MKQEAIGRRSFLAGAGAAGIALALGRAIASSPAGVNSAPNILFILADDLGYADLSCYGRTDFTTPTLDGLAAQGLQFTQGYANSSVCSATRTALVTGRYQYRLPVGLEEPVRDLEHAGLPPGHPTLPSLLRRAGYRTSLIGKWHVGSVVDAGPTKYGYDSFFGIAGGGADYFSHLVDPSGKTPNDGLYANTTPIERHGYLTNLLADEAIRQIETPSSAPFFMSLHFNAPHWPWEGPGDEDVSRKLTDLRHLDGGNLATYAAMVRSLDANIGRVLEALRKRGVEENSIVVFTSDNGGERFSDTWPFVGLKSELLEGGIRVPLIVRWPKRVRAGGRSEQVMISMDFLPTLLAAADTTPDPAFPPDGENLLAVWLGEATARPRRIYWRYKANEQAALRDGDWKYLKLAGREHLFDLAADVRERANLKDRDPERFARMKADYGAWDKTMLAYPPESVSGPAKDWYSDRY